MIKNLPVNRYPDVFLTANHIVRLNGSRPDEENTDMFWAERWPQVITKPQAELYRFELYPGGKPDVVFERALGEAPDPNNIVRGVMRYLDNSKPELSVGQLKGVTPWRGFRLIGVDTYLSYSPYPAATVQAVI